MFSCSALLFFRWEELDTGLSEACTDSPFTPTQQNVLVRWREGALGGVRQELRGAGGEESAVRFKGCLKELIRKTRLDHITVMSLGYSGLLRERVRVNRGKSCWGSRRERLLSEHFASKERACIHHSYDVVKPCCWTDTLIFFFCLNVQRKLVSEINWHDLWWWRETTDPILKHASTPQAS